MNCEIHEWDINWLDQFWIFSRKNRINKKNENDNMVGYLKVWKTLIYLLNNSSLKKFWLRK